MMIGSDQAQPLDEESPGYGVPEVKAPADFKALREHLATGKVRLPRKLTQVATYFLAHPDEIAFGTAATIAMHAEVQPSTLVRFAQTLGYSGFSELQGVFRERLKERPPTYEDRLNALRAHTEPASRTEILFRGFCDAAERSITRLRENIDPRAIGAAARQLAAADTIYLIARRRSYTVTTYLSYAFGKLGVKHVLLGSSAGSDQETLAFATERDAAIAIGFTPYAAETLAHARQIAERGAPLIVITDSPFSPLVAEALIWFEAAEADYEGFRSLSATMALAMALAVAVAELKRDTNE